jgi:hypothetical protein
MVDTTSEALLSLTQAAALLGKHTATVYRWSTGGVRGVVLETIQVGGTRCTSKEAVQRFCERLTGLNACEPQLRRPEAIGAERAAEELERHGV